MRFRQEVSFYNDEYITSVLRTQDTKFDVLQGYVGAMITESELEELRNGDRTMYSRLAGAELTIDGLNRTYQEVRTDYSAVTGTLNTLDSRVTEISESVDGITINVADIQIQANETDSQLAALSLTVDGFSSTVSQAKNEAISTANAATDSKLANYTRTANLMSYINQQTGSINLGVIANSSTLATKTYADTQATAAQNAAKNYADTQLTAYTKTADLTVDLDGIRTSVTEAKTEAISTANAATDNKLKDYTKTASLMSYINQQSGKIELGVIKNSSTLATKTYADGVGTSATNAANNATDQKLTEYTKTANLEISIDGIKTKVTSANIDLNGTKNAAVTEANSATDTKLADYTKTVSLMSYINQQAGSISLGVIEGGTGLATKTYAADQATAAKNAANTATDNKLKDYTKTANLEISINGIKTKVTSANIDLNGTKDAAVTAANTATDTKLADYTKTASLMSYINQQAGSISLGVIEGGTGLATKTYAADQATAAKNAANTATDNKLKDYTKTANLEISINGIKTKVTSANIDLNGTKEAAVTAANSATDEKLADYTKTASLMSYINQQAGSISLGVIADSNSLATKTYADTQATEAQNAAKNYTDNQVKPATICAAINSAGSSITLNANKINMNSDTFTLWANNAELTPEKIRLSATTIAWSCDNSTMDSSGNLTTKSLTATSYISVDGNNNSKIKIPLEGGSSYYTQLSKKGYEMVWSSGKFNLASGWLFMKHPSSDAVHSQLNYVRFKITDGTYGSEDVIDITGRRVELRRGGVTSIAIDAANGMYLKSGLVIEGTKSRVVQTQDYGRRRLYCYETPSPLFGDLGEGKVGPDGFAYISIDPVFSETITSKSYQVFLQKYGIGDICVTERHPCFFVVEGTPGIGFGWEIKAKQSDFDQYRLEDDNLRQSAPETGTYGLDGYKHINEIKNERMVI